MEVNDLLIEKLANLSRLELSDTEKIKMKSELGKMIGFINKLDEVDTTNIEPLRHMSDNKDVFRNDEVKGQISKEDVFKNAPLHDDHFFKVPKVIKK